MPTLPNYLYQYPQSKNYYFRIRIPIELCKKYSLTPFTFIASLQCYKLAQSRAYALFIKAKFERHWELIMEDIQEALAGFDKDKPFFDYEPTKWDFRAYLKEQFATYLSMSKSIIRGETESRIDLEKLTIPSNSDAKVYEEHLKESIRTGQSNTTLEHLAHPHYLLAYIKDYGEFLKSDLYPDVIKSEDEALDLSLNFNSSAEAHFKSYGYGEEMLDMLEINHDLPMDKHAINRFIARHGWLEFQFKKQLITEVSEYANNYNSFADEPFDHHGIRITQRRQFNQIFETFEETLNLIKSLKKEAVSNKKEKNIIKLKPTFELFLKEKSQSVKPDTIEHYRISFNFFFELLGENYDIRNINKKKAKEIKDAIIAKAANSEKGCSDKKLSVATVNRYMINFGAFLNWCNDNDYDVEKDLFTNLKLKETKVSKARRRPYTVNEIQSIKSYEFQSKAEAKKFRTDAFWYPKISLYTGMRLNEISFLTTDDFGVENGIHYISLEDKDLKNENSERRFPIHSKLIEYGLLDLVELRKKEKQKVLFIECREGKSEAGKYGWAEKISKWYNRTLVSKIGISKAEESKQGLMVDFHCLRTTFLSFCKRNGLNGYIVKQIVGHLGEDDVTFDVYGSEVSTKLSVMKSLIEKIDY
jgi:integrase